MFVAAPRQPWFTRLFYANFRLHAKCKFFVWNTADVETASSIFLLFRNTWRVWWWQAVYLSVGAKKPRPTRYVAIKIIKSAMIRVYDFIYRPSWNSISKIRTFNLQQQLSRKFFSQGSKMAVYFPCKFPRYFTILHKSLSIKHN